MNNSLDPKRDLGKFYPAEVIEDHFIIEEGYMEVLFDSFELGFAKAQLLYEVEEVYSDGFNGLPIKHTWADLDDIKGLLVKNERPFLGFQAPCKRDKALSIYEGLTEVKIDAQDFGYAKAVDIPMETDCYGKYVVGEPEGFAKARILPPGYEDREGLHTAKDLFANNLLDLEELENFFSVKEGTCKATERPKVIIRLSDGEERKEFHFDHWSGSFLEQYSEDFMEMGRIETEINEFELIGSSCPIN